MRIENLFARRYLLSKKSHSVINIISVVSAVAVAVPVAAMVILLSVFNGFEGLVKGMYDDFDPDVMVTPVRGKTFEVSSPEAKLRQVDGVESWSFVVEENAMADYRGGQSIVTLRGVDSSYAHVVPIENRMVGGEYRLRFGDIEQGVVGQGVAYGLGINPAMYDYLRLYAPRRDGISAMLPIESYRSELLLPAGVFGLDEQTDSRYVIAPIELVRRLFDYPGRATAIAVKVAPGADPMQTRTAIRRALGDEFRVLVHAEQHASLYRIMRYEKWGIFLIIGLVLVIASLTIVGSVVMLVIDKREDIRTLVTMGGTLRFLRAVFTREGMLIALWGALAGMVVGVAVSLGQHYFGWVKIPSETFLVDTYPVVLQGRDLLLIAALITVVSFSIVRLTANRMIPKRTLRLLIVALCLTLAGCDRPRQIPDETLQQLFTEIYLSNALIQNRSMRSDSVDPYTPLFEKYGYTPRDFTYTLEGFAQRKSSRISDIIDASIASLGADHDFYAARLAAIDTIEQHALNRYRQLVYSDTLIEARQVSDTGKLRIRLPVTPPGSYRIAYTYLLDTSDYNVGLHTTYTISDSTGKQLVQRTDWMARLRRTPYSINIDAPATGRRLEILFGNYGSGGNNMELTVTQPNLRIDSLSVYRYPPVEVAVDSLMRLFFPNAHPELQLPVYETDSLAADVRVPRLPAAADSLARRGR